MPLSGLSKGFDLEYELKKEYFPHFFNTPRLINYVGSLPHIRYHKSDGMKVESIAFIQWYSIYRFDTYDMQKDLVDYCVSNEDI